jgi:16S rRNA (cytidine1402-2'-O)-methyltransferase
MQQGQKIALVSDAGMPGISDPGHELIVSAIEHGIAVEVIPGPSALISAIVISGLPTAEFTFLGFPPRKAGERARFIERAFSSSVTVALFEAPKRLLGLLQLIARVEPERRVAVARELTKKFEEVLRGTAAELVAHFEAREPLGECVVLIEGSPEFGKKAKSPEISSPAELVERLIKEEGLSKKDAMRKAATQLGISRRDVYKALLKQNSAEK